MTTIPIGLFEILSFLQIDRYFPTSGCGGGHPSGGSHLSTQQLRKSQPQDSIFFKELSSTYAVELHHGYTPRPHLYTPMSETYLMLTALTPVHFFSHGSTMMLGEESESADYWKKCGDEALARNIKGVIIMGAHWDTLNDSIQLSTSPNPGKSPVAYVQADKYTNYVLNPDLPTTERCISLLAAEGFNVSGNPTFDWIHDVYLILIRMFPSGCPPTTLVSANARYDPHFHLKIGATLRPLRKENYLIIGTGGAVHNLYRNRWAPMLRFRDNFAMETPPEDWALEFRQAVEDVITKTSGSQLRRAMTRLMKHPRFRDAHATDDHFMAALFVAGAAGDEEDGDAPAVLGAESWELTNMCNSQFTLGKWKEIAV